MNAPSPHLVAHREQVEAAARLGPVLDLACGGGRHALAVAGWGAPVVAMDRSRAALAELTGLARDRSLPVLGVRADLETPLGIPVAPGSCGAILVFRFLFRPLAAAIAEALAPGGLLLYETFTIHQRDLVQGPNNPAFLLLDGELPGLFASLRIESHWEGVVPGPPPQALARLVARKADSLQAAEAERRAGPRQVEAPASSRASAQRACSASSGSGPSAWRRTGGTSSRSPELPATTSALRSRPR
jgi:SAM-dependent methyltransferase